MPLEILRARSTSGDSSAEHLIGLLEGRQADYSLEDALLYYGYPRYRDDEDELLAARVLVLSPMWGLALFGTINQRQADQEALRLSLERNEAVFAQIFGKLLTNKAIRKGARNLRPDTSVHLFAPFLSPPADVDGTKILVSDADVASLFDGKLNPENPRLFDEIVATIDGSRVIPRPKKRTTQAADDSKVALIARLEVGLAKFDNKQREGSLTNINAPQRIRGLAGSGKTIVLAKKAALAHLEDPASRIGYTFYTKSLYQQIRGLITRFYRDQHDRDPDWNLLNVLHAWGGKHDPGVYSVACATHGVQPIKYDEADRIAPGRAFDHVCSELLKQEPISPRFDLLFIDEGQDYPVSFLQLCSKFTKEMRFVYAYDDLQTIFQPTAPTAASIWGVDEKQQPRVQFERDIVLYKCYRNPLEILICAHAVGFGIYGTPVQMLENAEHWKDIGYEVRKGPLVAGSQVEILRPKENSLDTISASQSIDQMVDVASFKTFDQEIAWVVAGITDEIKEGLRPDDFMVAVVDDRNARSYLQAIADGLAAEGVPVLRDPLIS